MKERMNTMVKWKKISKKLLVAVTAATMLLGSQMTTFAYADQTAETAQTETEEKKTEENVLEEDHTDDGKSFSVPGNAEVLDDIDGDSSKEFLTVTTKNNNTFYIVIDRSSATDNVYMLSQIDENDLKDFLDEEKSAKTEMPDVVLDDVHTEDETPEVTVEDVKETEKSDMGTNVGLLSILLLAGAGIGAYYYFKIYKGKQEEDDYENEGLEQDGAVEEATINEDEEEAKKASTDQNN